MFRRVFPILMAALILAGCAEEPAAPTTVPTTAATAETTTPATTLATTEAPTTEATQEPTITETTQAPTTEATQAPTAAEPEQGLPYLQKIPRPDQSIYDGPGYDYGFVGTVRVQGTYTIVEESTDYEGNLWGRLKSGIGWVDLTQIQSGHYESDLISANYAEEDLLRGGAYHHYSASQEYSIPITFRAYGVLRDVALFCYEFDDEGFKPGADLFSLPELTPEKPLVAELDFPGDMTTFGIRFRDESGISHTCQISISGRNGAVILTTE